MSAGAAGPRLYERDCLSFSEGLHREAVQPVPMRPEAPDHSYPIWKGVGANRRADRV